MRSFPCPFVPTIPAYNSVGSQPAIWTEQFYAPVQIHERDSQISADGTFAVGCECSLGTPLFRNVRSNSPCNITGHRETPGMDESSCLAVGRWQRCKGGTATYGFETNAPAELSRFFGWSKSVLKSGDRITVEYAPLRSGNNGGALIRLTFADGRELLTPRSNTPPPVGLANPAGQK